LNRLVLLGLLAFGLLLLGLGMLRAELLALALPVLVFILAGLVFSQENPQLTAVRRLSARRVNTGQPVTVRVTLANQGGRLELVSLADQVPPGLEMTSGKTSLVASLGPGQSVSFEYEVIARRGQYSLPELVARVSDPLGLVSRSLPLGQADSISVLPQFPPIGRILIHPEHTRAFPGAIPARVGGPGVTFFGVREYQLGDAWRQVNWHASARHMEEIYSNEFEQDRAADIGLILDSRRESYLVAPGQTMFEYAVTAAASLAQSFLAEGNRVGLVQYGQYISWTFPGYGKLQRERILSALAQAATGESLVDHLEHLPVRFFPPRSQIVLVSPLQARDLDVLLRFRAQGYAVLVISPDPIAFEVAHLPGTAAVRLAARVARLERVVLLRQLGQAGIRVLDWNLAIPFDRAVVALRRGRVPILQRSS
jgi:uncharacterized protein (DUF58 family)